MTNKLALSVQVFPLLVKLFPWSDDHVGSRILHWLVRAHGMGAVVHALMVGVNRHLHHVLLVRIWRAVLSQKWRIALDRNGLRSMMSMHPVVWVVWGSVAWMPLVVPEVPMILHFHWMTWMIWHLAWVRIANIHVRMLWLHGVGM